MSTRMSNGPSITRDRGIQNKGWQLLPINALVVTAGFLTIGTQGSAQQGLHSCCETADCGA